MDLSAFKFLWWPPKSV